MDFGIIVLAIIQGITEFLPVSSSAHLIIFRDLFGIGTSMSGDIAIVFDVALHFGTLLAILVYFFKDWLNIIVKGFTKPKEDGKLLWYLVAATIPAALMGVLFEDKIDELVRGNFCIIGAALIIMGIVLYIADAKSERTREIKDITLKDALIIGCSQVFALIPGFSRSGTTITAERFLKIDRKDSAKFSFYLSAPVVAGGFLLHIIKSESRALILDNLLPFGIGIIVSFIIGLLCIKFLLQYLNKHSYKVFMIYRVLMGILVIVLALIRG